VRRAGFNVGQPAAHQIGDANGLPIREPGVCAAGTVAGKRLPLMNCIAIKDSRALRIISRLVRAAVRFCRLRQLPGKGDHARRGQ
jgi:hypothetical protein